MSLSEEAITLQRAAAAVQRLGGDDADGRL